MQKGEWLPFSLRSVPSFSIQPLAFSLSGEWLPLSRRFSFCIPWPVKSLRLTRARKSDPVKTRNTSEWVVKGDGMGCGGRVAMGPQGGRVSAASAHQLDSATRFQTLLPTLTYT